MRGVGAARPRAAETRGGRRGRREGRAAAGTAGLEGRGLGGAGGKRVELRAKEVGVAVQGGGAQELEVGGGVNKRCPGQWSRQSQ